ncbi:MAG: hypothetical protein ACHQ0Y_08965 [Thermodesulfovibrionales bacterium]
MKATISRVVAFLVIFLIMGVSMAYADPAPSAGYPAVSFLSAQLGAQPLQIGVVSKFEAGSFTQAEAESMSEEVTTIVSTLLGSTLGTSSTLVLSKHLTPNQLAAKGFSSADVLAAFALTHYKNFGALIYIFLDVSRTQGVAGSEMGNNIRIDVWIGDAANLLSGSPILSTLGVTGNYLYVTSLEIPESFLPLAISLGL